MDKAEASKKVRVEEDFIRSPKFENSLSKFLHEPVNSNGVNNEIIARLLVITPEEVESLYQEAIKQLQKAMGVK